MLCLTYGSRYQNGCKDVNWFEAAKVQVQMCLRYHKIGKVHQVGKVRGSQDTYLG